MKAVIDAALNRRPASMLIFIVLLMAGIYAYIAIPKESNPDINIPIIYVSMTHDGISPNDAERLLIRPMEQELFSIEGVQEMKSSGYEGGANVVLEFIAGFDSDKALDDVRLAVDKAKVDLPDETDEPAVSEVNFSLFPALVVILSGDVPERVLLKTARDIKDKLEGLSQVLEVNIAGDRKEQLEIVVDSNAIESYGLSGLDIISFFQRSNRLVASGNMDTGVGRFAIKVPGVFETLDDIRTMPVKTDIDSVVRVDDVADVRFNYKDPTSFARLNGKRALALEVVKRTGENVIEMTEAVRNLITEESKYWPEAIKIDFVKDESNRIRTKLSDLQNNVLSAILLVMIVCLAALGFRSALLVGIAIPGAFLSGVLFLYISGMTVNIVVLFALILSIGLLVDGAIVVTEYADRKMSEGLKPKEAYGQAAKRMSWPITASTATTLAAFFPLLFWPDTVGQFMRFMPLTLIAVLISSLFVALIFVPVMGSFIGKPVLAKSPEATNLDEIKGSVGLYLKVLKQVLRVPGFVLLLAIILLVSVQVYYKNHGHGIKFFPDIEPDVANIEVRARGNLSIFEQDNIMKEVELAIFDVTGIETFYTRIGKSEGSGSGGGGRAEDVIGVIQIELLDWQERPKAQELLDIITNKTKHIAGIVVEARKEKKGPQTGKDIQLQIRSRSPPILDDAINRILDKINNTAGFVDVEDTRALPGIEWELQVDRAEAAKFGLDITTIGQSVRLVTNGLKISDYRTEEAKDEIDVILRFPENERSLRQLDKLHIETSLGSVPIENFAKRVAKPKTGVINRVNGYREITIRTNVSEGINVEAKVQEIQAWLSTQKWDPRLQFIFKGENEKMNNSMSFLTKAFIVALAIMAIIMVMQFNSYYSALLILSAVVMSTMGVMIGLIITGNPFVVVMSGIGVIALAGIIVNNNIVLIDTFDHLMKTGRFTVKEAILRTGAQRLRPVLLTTVTTILGLLPMVFQVNIDFFNQVFSIGAPSTQWWVDLATAIVFGLLFSTPLTLLLTPSALMFRENCKGYLQWCRTRMVRQK